jgi:hypothetical protein
MLKLVEGNTHELIDGEDVVVEVGLLIRERLPHIPLDDPFRLSLESYMHMALAGKRG